MIAGAPVPPTVEPDEGGGPVSDADGTALPRLPEDPTATVYHHSEGLWGVRRTAEGCWLTNSHDGLVSPLVANFGEASMIAEWVAKAMNEWEPAQRDKPGGH